MTEHKCGVDPTLTQGLSVGARFAVLDRSGHTSQDPVPAQHARVVLITTVPETAASFLSQQIKFLAARGFDVQTITSPGMERLPKRREFNSVLHEVAMTRGMNPVADVFAIFRLWRLLRRLRPDIVQTHTPKAGLVGVIAAWLARVPVRIYTINGLPILTQPLWCKVILGIADWLTCQLASEVLCVSRSVRRFMITQGLCSRRKARTLGDGGFPGVDTDKFSPATHGRADRARIRDHYRIPEGALLLSFIGRIVPDKGIAELTTAWNVLRDEFPELRLLLCGYYERDHPLPPAIIERLENDPRVHMTGGMVADMPPIYAALDVCVLPTYREGLPNVVLECGAMQVPIVATRVQGCIDSIRNGITGLVVEPKDPDALAEALRRLLRSAELRKRMGVAARTFVAKRFSEEKIFGRLLEEYCRLMEARCPESSVTIRSAISVRDSSGA